MIGTNRRQVLEAGLARQAGDPRQAVYHAPLGVYLERAGLHLVLDPEAPHWLATNAAGAQILRLCDGRRTVAEVAAELARTHGLAPEAALADTLAFLQQAAAAEFAGRRPALRPPYPGRAATVAPARLSELYVFVTNDCNLRCTHCYVSSGDFVPANELSGAELVRLVDEARALGVSRFYFTGGEPFLRRDIFELIAHVCAESELVLLTNAHFFNQSTLARLADLAGRANPAGLPPRLHFQVSLDGAEAGAHEQIRGRRSFARTVQGIRDLVRLGLTPAVSTAITQHNVDHMADVTRLLGSLGVREHHILWLQERGRAHEHPELLIPPAQVTAIMRELRAVAADLGMIMDNEASLRVRVRGKHGRKTDLCNCGYESLDVFSDGQVYPCVWFSGAPGLACGSVREQPLRDIWLHAPVLQAIRENSVQRRAGCNECHLKFLCGGGNSCASYFDSLATQGHGSIQAADPYCETYLDLTHDLLWELASAGVGPLPPGYTPPTIYNAMEGQGAACARPHTAALDSAFEVGSFHCACVLQGDVADGQPVRAAARLAAQQAGDLPEGSGQRAAGSDEVGSGQRAAGSDEVGSGQRAAGREQGSVLTTNHSALTTDSALSTQHSALAEDAVFDGMGQACVDLLLAMARQVRALPPGAVLKVVTDDPAAREDLGAWCRMTGHELAATVRGQGYASYYIRRGPQP